MVRKWSYLNETWMRTDDSFLVTFMRRHRFKVFRASTRFKKFNVGLARIVRRLGFWQKRRTKLLPLAYITAVWIKYFSKSRQFYRFVQSHGLFTLTAYSAGTLFIHKRLASSAAPAGVEGGINSYACTNKLLTGLVGTEITENHFLRSRTGSSANAAIATHRLKNHEILSHVGPNALRFDRLSYPYDIYDASVSSTELLGIFNKCFLRHQILFAKIVRGIIVHLVLINAVLKR